MNWSAEHSRNRHSLQGWGDGYFDVNGQGHLTVSLPMLQPRCREHSLPLHRPKSGETCLLGFFMLGAYQEILGDIHNLFGDTDTVNLDIHADGSFSLNNPEHGDRVDELLAYVHFKLDKLRAVYRQRVQTAGLAAQQARRFIGTGSRVDRLYLP